MRGKSYGALMAQIWRRFGAAEGACAKCAIKSPNGTFGVFYGDVLWRGTTSRSCFMAHSYGAIRRIWRNRLPARQREWASS